MERKLGWVSLLLLACVAVTQAGSGSSTNATAKPALDQTGSPTTAVSDGSTPNAVIAAASTVPLISSLNPNWAAFGTFTLTVNGSGFVSGSKIVFNGVPVTTRFVSSTSLTASVTARPIAGAIASVNVQNPEPGGQLSVVAPLPIGPINTVTSYASSARFLEQASFGPTPESMARVQLIGFEAWMNEQRNASMSTYPEPAGWEEWMPPMQKQFFVNAVHGEDQLRQRMAFTLGQILVVSGNRVGRAQQMVPYQRLLLKYAFSNYRTILQEVTLNPTMGRYLDMVNNEKARPGRVPNENFARELMQLFTIGPVLLNQDGSPKLDSQGRTIPTYTQEHVVDISRALTGWTSPLKPGASMQPFNPEYYNGKLLPWEANHDSGAKTLPLGRTLPASQSASQDLNDVLQHLFEHPNTPPFLALRLIQHHVMSNPSPAYIRRVADVFVNNGAGVRGDMWAVLKAVLLDPEARDGDALANPPPTTGGHLREPVLLITSLCRALGSRVVSPDHILVWRADHLGQMMFEPPSVFSFYSPSYRVPGESLLGPEFQLHTASAAAARMNIVGAIINSYYPGTTTDISPFERLSGDPQALVRAVRNALHKGHMARWMEDIIVGAMLPVSSPRTRARNALYLGAVSPLYQVQQ